MFWNFDINPLMYFVLFKISNPSDPFRNTTVGYVKENTFRKTDSLME